MNKEYNDYLTVSSTFQLSVSKLFQPFINPQHAPGKYLSPVCFIGTATGPWRSCMLCFKSESPSSTSESIALELLLHHCRMEICCAFSPVKTSARARQSWKEDRWWFCPCVLYQHFSKYCYHQRKIYLCISTHTFTSCNYLTNFCALRFCCTECVILIYPNCQWHGGKGDN